MFNRTPKHEPAAKTATPKVSRVTHGKKAPPEPESAILELSSDEGGDDYSVESPEQQTEVQIVDDVYVYFIATKFILQMQKCLDTCKHGFIYFFAQLSTEDQHFRCSFVNIRVYCPLKSCLF